MKIKRLYLTLSWILVLVALLFLGCYEAAQQLDTPQQIRYDDATKTITWEAVPNAESYIVEIDGREKQSEQNLYSFEFFDSGTYHVRVKAVADGIEFIDSEWSNSFGFVIEDEAIEASSVVLVLESVENESEMLVSIIQMDFEVDVMHISQAPDTLVGLRMYLEVVLVNIANSDMPDGFAALLHTYVHTYGGGVFTVGGNKPDLEEANTYVEEDMNPLGEPSVYQQMLPVHCIGYSPAVAVMFVMDTSGSMEYTLGDLGETRMAVSKKSVKECLSVLGKNDYVGIVSFSDSARLELKMTSVSSKTIINGAIDNITSPMGGTYYGNAINLAHQTLMDISEVKAKHIIIISDGEPSDSAMPNTDENGYNYYIDQCVQAGISISVVAINKSDLSAKTGQEIANRGNGSFYVLDRVGNLSVILKNDIVPRNIGEYITVDFVASIYNYTSVVSGINQANMPILSGYYCTTPKEEAQVSLGVDGVPIYASWQYGEGNVGSIMCDLNGNWSQEFLESETGIQIIKNIIHSLKKQAS